VSFAPSEVGEAFRCDTFGAGPNRAQPAPNNSAPENDNFRRVFVAEASKKEQKQPDQEATDESGSGGDAGSGPTGAITPGDVDSAGGNAVVMSGAAFTAGLVTGLLIGWFVSG
jgi:hypothetical protein